MLKEVETATNKVSVQLESICQEFSWLSDVWEFVRLWKGGQCVLADEFEASYCYTVSSEKVAKC